MEPPRPVPQWNPLCHQQSCVSVGCEYHATHYPEIHAISRTYQNPKIDCCWSWSDANQTNTAVTLPDERWCDAISTASHSGASNPVSIRIGGESPITVRVNYWGTVPCQSRSAETGCSGGQPLASGSGDHAGHKHQRSESISVG